MELVEKKQNSVVLRLSKIKNIEIINKVVYDINVLNITINNFNDLLSENMQHLISLLSNKNDVKLTIKISSTEFNRLPHLLFNKLKILHKKVLWKIKINNLEEIGNLNKRISLIGKNEKNLFINLSTLLKNKEELSKILEKSYEMQVKAIKIVVDFKNLNINSVEELNALIKEIETSDKNKDQISKLFEFENIPLCALYDLEQLTPFYIKTEKKHYKKQKECEECTLKDYCIGVKEDEKIKVKPFSNSEKFKYLNTIAKKRYALYEYILKIKPTLNNIYDTYAIFLMGDSSKRNKYYKKEEMMQFWEEWVRKVKNNELPEMIYLYIHFPYCITNCAYCIYPSTKVKSKEDIEEYLEFIIQELKDFAPIFKGIKFRAFNMGGGTPSLMSANQLDKLLGTVFSLYDFEDGAEKGIEFNPESTTLEKLRVLEKYGFQKLSIGVQTLSRKVLKYANREYQTLEGIKRFFEYFNQTKLPFLNVDVVMGLYSDTPEDFLYTIEELCKLRPNLISVYPIKTDREYIKKWYKSEENFLKFYYPYVEKIVKEVPKVVKKYDMRTSIKDISELSFIHPFDIFDPYKPPVKGVKYRYANFTKEPYSLLAFGFYSNGHIAEKIHYNFVEKELKGSTLFIKEFSHNPKDYGFLGMPLRKNYEKVKFLVFDVLEHYILHKKDFERTFNKTIYEVFPHAINELKALGILSETETEYRFKVKDEREMYIPMLFFLDIESILLKIKHFMNYTNPYVRDLNEIKKEKLDEKERKKFISS